MGIQSLFDYDSSNIENCANKEDFSCDKENGCVSYQSDIESVLKDMKREYVPLYHLIERETGETMGVDSCFASQLKAGELFCSDDCTLNIDDDEGDDESNSFAYFLSEEGSQSNICKKGYLQRMELNSAPYRKACLTSLLVHQYSRMCGADKELANGIATAAFSWYKGNYNLNKRWTHDHCPSIIEHEVERRKEQKENSKLHYSVSLL